MMFKDKVVVVTGGAQGIGRCCTVCFEREGAERMLLLGDVLYHGPRNDLPRDYAPKEVAAQLNAMADRVLGVRGNCDAEIDQAVLRFPIMADYALLCEGGRTVFATHGHLYNLDCMPPLHPPVP